MEKEYAKGYDREELALHYEALIGESEGLTREQMIEELEGTEFDEFAYAGENLYAEAPEV